MISSFTLDKANSLLRDKFAERFIESFRHSFVRIFGKVALRISLFGDAVAGPLLGRRGDQKGVEEKVRGSYEKQEASGRKREKGRGGKDREREERGEEEEQEEYRSARGE